jgi:hypothetical protein
MAVLGLSGNVVISASMLFASSGAWALFNMTAVTMRQRQVPDGLLGRVTSLYGTAAPRHWAQSPVASWPLSPECALPCWPVPSRSPSSQWYSRGGTGAAINFLMPSPR